MREKSNAQTSLFDPQAVDHPVADELERAFAWLDAHPELLEEVAADLGARSGSGRGRRGLSCETVLRCALLKHLRRETYRGLEFILRDSLSAWRFARFEASRLPGKSALQSTVGSIRAEPGSASTATCWARRATRRSSLGIKSASTARCPIRTLWSLRTASCCATACAC